MATAIGKARCVACGKENAVMKCGGCSEDFCFNHMTDHRQELSKQLDEIEVTRDLFRQTLTEQTSTPQKHPLMQQIDQWEHDSMNKIRQTAAEARQLLLKHTTGYFTEIEVKLNKLTNQLREGRQENDFIETDLQQWKEQLKRLEDELNKPSTITIRDDSTPLVTNICVNVSAPLYIPSINANARWTQNGVTMAGGNGQGNGINQLSCPNGLYIDNDQTIYITEWLNHRIVEWKNGTTSGQVVAGGNGQGYRNDQLNNPSNVIVDKENDSLIICDYGNRRVMRWPHQNGTSGETIISGISCWDLARDNYGYLYVSDFSKHEVRRWKIGDNSGIVVAGGNGQGNHLDQLSNPTHIFVDQDYSVYVSDGNNHRIMKWMKGAKEGIVVAGGHGQGNGLTQLSNPRGVFIDQLGTVYVADVDNHRVMRWAQGATRGTVVVGGNGSEEQANQLSKPITLSFDRQNNLYVADRADHRISTINEYLNWLEGSFVLNIRAQQWYNGESPRNLSGFMNDKFNRLISWITMRQLRVKSKLCSIPSLNLTCQYDYSFSNEEKHSFEIGWTNETTIKSTSKIPQAFEYKSSGELDMYVYTGDHGSYSGSGYVYEFRGRLSDIQSNLSELHQLRWIDNHNRAIIIQLNLCNPNTKLSTSVTLLIEFLSTGGVYSQSNFEPMNFYAFTSLVQLICTILYMILIIYFMLMEIRLCFRLKWNYFHEFRSLIELGIIICSWMGVGIYVWRYREYSRISELFRTTNGYVYINLQLSTYINNFSTFVYGFCCFFGIIELIRLCRFNQRIYLFIQTIKYAGKELLSFAMMFSIVFFSFLCLFYFLFVSKLWSCSTFYQTAEILYQMTVMKYDVHELSGAAVFLGPFCFSLFIILVVFVCLSMFLSMINQSFLREREDMKHHKDNQQIYSFMFDKFLCWIGLKKRTEEEIHEERDAVMLTEYFDPIERFLERMDQLLDVINRLYTTQILEQSRI